MIGRRPDGWSWICNFLIRCTRIRTKLTVVLTNVFELRFLPYVWARPDGNPRRPDGCINLTLFELGKNLKLIDHWTSSGRAAESSGRMQAGTKAFRYSGESGRKYTSSGRMMLYLYSVRTVWHVVRTDGTVDRWASRRDGTVVRTADREPKIFWLASKIFWNTTK
jgi:hypothetical protein